MIGTSLTNTFNFSSLFNNPSFSDFQFEFHNETSHQSSLSLLYAHKLILNQNDFFQSLFQTNTLEMNENKMKITENVIQFSLLIKSLYETELFLNFDSLDELLPFILLSDKYQFLKVRDLCCQSLSNLICKENCILIWMFSNDKDYLAEINQKAAQTLKLNFFEGRTIDLSNVVVLNLINSFNLEELLHFLESMITSNTNTDVLLSIILKWAENDLQSRSVVVYKILQQVEKKKKTELYNSAGLWIETKTTKLRKEDINSWKIFFGNKSFHAFEPFTFSIKIDDFIKSDSNDWSCITGTANDKQTTNTWLGGNTNGYGFIVTNGYKNHNSGGGEYYAGRSLNNGDVLTVNLQGNGTLEFLINGQSCGTAFYLPQNVMFKPAVSLCCKSVSLEFVL